MSRKQRRLVERRCDAHDRERADVLAAGARGSNGGAPYRIHFSDISYANWNEKSDLRYGEGGRGPSRLRTRWRASNAGDGDRRASR